jgi:hypothetical protein
VNKSAGKRGLELPGVSWRCGGKSGEGRVSGGRGGTVGGKLAVRALDGKIARNVMNEGRIFLGDGRKSKKAEKAGAENDAG